MRILHLNSEKGWRGGEQQLVYLVESTEGQSVSHLVICHQQSALEKYCREHQIPHISLRLTKGISLRAAVTVRQICQTHKIDLMHVHGSKMHTIAVLSTLLGNPTPIVLSRRVAFPVRKNFLTRWKYNHLAVKKIICISEAVKKVVRQSIVRPERLTVVYSGIDVQKFQSATGYLRSRYAISSNQLIVGNVAALSASKGLYTWVDTFENFLASSIPAHGIIVGEGDEREALERYIQDKGLQQHITLTGFLSNVPQVLPEFDIFLTTAQIEGLGTSVLDAFACHVPVVATRAGGIPEMVIHERTGMLADVGDTLALSSYLKKIAKHPHVRDKITHAAYQHLLNHFTKERMAQKTVDSYRSLLTTL